MLKTAIVILNWNGRNFLERFLPALVKSVQNCPGAEVIVADNASSDGSLQWLSDHYPDIRQIPLDKNYGFTGGYNKAFQQIDAPYYLLLNSDVEVTDGWLEPLVEWIDSHTLCGACVPKILSYAHREKFEYAGAAGGLIDKYGYPFCRGRVMGMTEKDYGQYDESEDVMWGSGACLLVRSDLYHKLGGLDERFFAHQEEIDLCWRIQLEGYKVTVVPESKIYHVGGGTLPNRSVAKLELNYRNNLLMLSNNLAKTIALDYFNENFIEAEGAMMVGDQDEREEMASEAAVLGLKKASQIIFRRMLLDGCSAAAYLVTLRFKAFKAVFSAHRQYRSLVRETTFEQVRDYIIDYGKIAGVEGIYRKSILMQVLLHGKDVFKRIRTEIQSM